MGMENISSEVLKRKHTDSEASGISISFPKLDKENEKTDSDDDESDITMWIDYFDTPNPVLRVKSHSFTNGIKVQKVSEIEEHYLKSEENSDHFRIPDSSQVSKSRANSEKNVNQKKLLTNKVSSDTSNTTQSSSLEKNKTSPKDEEMIKANKSFGLANLSVQNEQNTSLKDVQIEEPKTNKLPMPPKLDLNMFTNEEFLKDAPNFDGDESMHSVDFMQHCPKEIEEPKFDFIQQNHEQINKDLNFSMQEHESIDEFPKLDPNPIHGFVDNRFEFDELEDHNNGFNGNPFLNEELIGSHNRYD